MTTTIYQYIFFRLESEPHKPAYVAFDPNYSAGSPWTPDTSGIYKPFPNLDRGDPLGANPTAFYFGNNIYMLLRTNNFFNLTGKKVILQSLDWTAPQVDLSITSEDTALPLVTTNYLHVFHQESAGDLKWSRFDTNFDEEKKEPDRTKPVASLLGFPSPSVAYRTEYGKYVGRLFYRHRDGMLASKDIQDLDGMALSDGETLHRELLLSESPSTVNSHDDKGVNTFYVFYQSKDDHYLKCARIDAKGGFLGDYNLSSGDRGGPEVRLYSSPSAVIVGDRAGFARVFYIGGDRKVKRVIVNLKEMKIISHETVPTSATLPGLSPFAMTAPILIKNFSPNS